MRQPRHLFRSQLRKEYLGLWVIVITAATFDQARSWSLPLLGAVSVKRPVVLPLLDSGARLLRLLGGNGSPHATVVSPPFVFVSDLDDTLVGSTSDLAKFNHVWQTEFAARGCKLVYNTGRSLQDYQLLCKDWPLLVPDLFIGGCGTQMYSVDRLGSAIQDRAWTDSLQSGWEKQLIETLVFESVALREKYGGLKQKRESLENPLMFSMCIPNSGFSLEDVKSDFERLLANQKTSHGAALVTQVCVASVAYGTNSTVTRSDDDASGSLPQSSIFLDILPQAAGKGPAQVYAAKAFGFGPEQILVAGDRFGALPTSSVPIPC